MNRIFYSFLFVVLYFSATASGTPVSKVVPASFCDSLLVRVYSKGRMLKTSPHPCSNGELKLSVRSSVDLHFYVFDLSGTLLHRATLNDRGKSMLPVLQKGTYLYDIFQNDLSIEEGRIIIK